MAQFDFSDYLASPSVKGAPNASLPVAPPHGDRASRLAAPQRLVLSQLRHAVRHDGALQGHHGGARGERGRDVGV